jgi:hypothetical protein
MSSPSRIGIVSVSQFYPALSQKAESAALEYVVKHDFISICAGRPHVHPKRARLWTLS